MRTGATGAQIVPHMGSGHFQGKDLPLGYCARPTILFLFLPRYILCILVFNSSPAEQYSDTSSKLFPCMGGGCDMETSAAECEDTDQGMCRPFRWKYMPP